MMIEPFENRRAAGRLLAKRLTTYQDRNDVLVLGLPRGGVPVAYEVAHALYAPLDIWLVRKLGVPGHKELALGAIASGGVRVLNEDVMRTLHISLQTVEAVTAVEQRELTRRELAFRGERPPPRIRAQTIILVDDGIATGATIRASVAALKQKQPNRLIIATPIASPEACEMLRSEVDELICLAIPDPFYAIGFWYVDFAQTSDNEVRDLLKRAYENLGATHR